MDFFQYYRENVTVFLTEDSREKKTASFEQQTIKCVNFLPDNPNYSLADTLVLMM